MAQPAGSNTHVGPLCSLPKNASIGIRYLKIILPTLDALERVGLPDIRMVSFVHPSATFIINCSPPASRDKIFEAFRTRERLCSEFSREVHHAWDVEDSSGNGIRTVFVESMTTNILRDDPEGIRIKVPEFAVMKIQRWEDYFDDLCYIEFDGGDKDAAGFGLMSMKTIKDYAALEEQAKKVAVRALTQF